MKNQLQLKVIIWLIN